MSLPAIKKSVKQIRDHNPAIPIEVSGNITLETVQAFAQAGVDFVSIGALTQAPPTVDLGMRITADVF